MLAGSWINCNFKRWRFCAFGLDVSIRPFSFSTDFTSMTSACFSPLLHGSSWLSCQNLQGAASISELAANSGSPWRMPSVSMLSHCKPVVDCKKSYRTYPSGNSMSDSFKDSGISVSGYINLDTAKAAGADITEALNKWDAETPIPMYAARTLPAIVANPPVMMAWSSDMVTCSKNGLTKSGASVCDEKCRSTWLLSKSHFLFHEISFHEENSYYQNLT